MRRRLARALLFVVASVAWVACAARAPAPPATPAAPPTTPESCRTACNGEWGRHGLAEVDSCNCRTRDAGKRCRDGLECEGECMLEEGAVEVTDPGPPRKGRFLGKCAEFQTTFGCARRASDGALREGPVALDDPPPELCVD